MPKKKEYYIKAEQYWELRDAIDDATKSEGLDEDSFDINIKFNKDGKAIGFQIIGESTSQFVTDVGKFQ